MTAPKNNREVAGRIGGLMCAARNDMRPRGVKAQQTMRQRFIDQVPADITDPAERARKGELLYRAHMAALSLKAARSRRKKRPAELKVIHIIR